MKERVIVYALGEYWKTNKEQLRERYDIIACSDRRPDAKELAEKEIFILPEQILNLSFDKIIIGCIGYGIREVLVLDYNIPFEKIFYYMELVNEKRIHAVKKVNKQHQNKLTIVIPTYNRESRLRRTLNILEKQTDTDFKIIILDNSSEYDIDTVLEGRNVQFQEKVTIVRHRRNIGMIGNLSMAFIQETEGWIWTLADDDIPSINAVEIIYEQIEMQKEIGAIHFSIRDMDMYLPRGYMDFYSFADFFGFYREIINDKRKMKLLNGDFLFFSNKVYNLKYLKKYIDKIFTYAYSGVPQLIPILYMLDEKEVPIRISNEKIVGYDAPDGDGWNYIQVMLGARILADLPISMSEQDRSVLYRLTILDYNTLIKSINMQNLQNEIKKIEIIYNEIYKYILTDEEKEDYYFKMEQLMKK